MSKYGFRSPLYRKDQPLKKRASAGYAAAKTPRALAGWNPIGTGNVNDIIRMASPIVRGRVRDLTRNFPYLTRANNILVNYTYSTGIHFQSKVTDRSGNLITRLNQQIEDAFNFWAEDCDISGRLHYHEIGRLAKRQDGENGEFLIIKRKPRGKSYLPYKLQIIEPEWLDNTYDGAKGNFIEVDQGVKFDTRTGEVLSFFFRNPDQYTSTIEEVKAESVIHGFDTLRPGQIRGISPFAPGVLLAGELQNLINSGLDTASMAAKYLAFVTTADAEDHQNALEEEGDKDSPRMVDEIENVITQYLEPGESVEFANPPNVGSNIDPLSKLILRMLAITSDIPYDLLTMDTGDLNYSKGKMVRVDFREALKVLQWRHTMHFSQPIVKPFYDWLALSDKVSMPHYARNQAFYMKPAWQPPGMESIDPARETKSMIDRIKFCQDSEIAEAKRRGVNYEDVIKEKAMAKQIREKYGVKQDIEMSTALANNPAKIEEQK